MSRKFFAALVIALALAAFARAQNTNSSTAGTRAPSQPRGQTTNANTRPTPAPREGAQPAATPTPRPRPGRSGASAARASDPAAQAVRAVFDNLVRGIERSDVEAVMSLYWNSPQLIIFNNNGTVTRSWEQVRSNRASSYPEAKNVKIETRDVRVSMLGRNGALVTCLWRQSQEFRGTPESASGRLTVVFRLINQGWKIVHTHTSPEAPDPSRLLPSEQTAPTPRDPAKPTATPPPR